MCQTLFIIPARLYGIPLFGFGWLLGVWAITSIVTLGWQLYRHGWSPQTRSYLPTLLLSGAAIAFLLPRLTEAAGLPIRGYGVMLLIAVASAVGMSVYRAERVGLNPEMILTLASWLFVSGIVGARLFYIIEYWDKFQKPTLGETLATMANVAQGGLVVYGSLLAGGLALIVFVYKHHLPGLALADLVAPSVVLGMALGRVGCFLNGCCYGGLTSLPWAVTFPWGSPPHQKQVLSDELYVHGLLFEGQGNAPPMIAQVEPDSQAASAGVKPGDWVQEINGVDIDSVEKAQLVLLDLTGEGRTIAIKTARFLAPSPKSQRGAGASKTLGDPQTKSWTLSGPAPRSRPIHPAQLYSFVDALLLCLFLVAYYPFRRRDGAILALLLTLHPISRYMLEDIRIDESAVFATPWSISQNISLGLLAAGVALWIYILWRPARVAFPKAALA
jgi:phosphatidylglycerol---prolipoprotein diacylglyceryl transferase